MQSHYADDEPCEDFELDKTLQEGPAIPVNNKSKKNGRTENKVDSNQGKF